MDLAAGPFSFFRAVLGDLDGFLVGGLTGQRVGFKACLPVMADAGLCFIRRASLATLPACKTCQCLLRVGAATTNFCELRLTGSHAADCEPEICVRFAGSCYR